MATADKALYPSADTLFFLLDEEGILYSESRQELVALNTPAAYIWCCLEEKYRPEQIIREYSKRFSPAEKDARAEVLDILQLWLALGFIEGGPIEHGRMIDLTTVLGRLLANPALRSRLAEDPRKLAKELGVRSSELASFLALKPAQLETQADLLAAQREAVLRESPSRISGSALLSLAAEYESLLETAVKASLKYAEPPFQSVFRLMTTNFCLRCSTREQQQALHSLFAHLEIEPDAPADVLFNVIAVDHTHLVTEDLLPLRSFDRLDRVPPLIQSRVKQLAIERHRFFMEIHGGVVSNGSACILIPGRMGIGKTTLTAALLQAGFTFFSDDVALLENRSMQVRPFPLSLIIKSGGEPVLSSFYAGLRQLPTFLRQDAQTVRYLKPSRDSLPENLERALPVRWIIFPERVETGTPALISVPRPQALQSLLSESIVLPAGLEPFNVQGLVNWIREVECLQLRSSSLDSAVELIAEHSL